MESSQFLIIMKAIEIKQIIKLYKLNKFLFGDNYET